MLVFTTQWIHGHGWIDSALCTIIIMASTASWVYLTVRVKASGVNASWTLREGDEAETLPFEPGVHLTNFGNLLAELL